jgi:hypothetical protein
MRPNTHEGAAAKDAHGAELLDGLRAAKSAAAKLPPISATSASDRNARRAKAEKWDGGTLGRQHTPQQ